MIPQISAAIKLNEKASFWFPPQASTVAPASDSLFYFIYWLCVFFFVLITGLTAYFVWKYRRKPGVEPLPSPSHNTTLELTWSIIPTFIVIAIFWWGFVGYMDMRTPPKEGYEIQVVAKKWAWLFQYPGGLSDAKLHLPKDRNTILTMRSEDVLHSFFIPAFRNKMDIVPGRYTKIWLHPTLAGQYKLYCTEYCGRGHSDMLADVEVYDADKFDAALAKVEDDMNNMDPVKLGELMYNQRGCAQCHSLKPGETRVGPSFAGSFGTQRELADGGSVTVDENYIRESILEPNAKVAKGFRPQMPSFKGQLKDKQIDGLIALIKSLK